jgi:uncharacterized protein (UPF0335 family)
MKKIIKFLFLLTTLPMLSLNGDVIRKIPEIAGNDLWNKKALELNAIVEKIEKLEEQIKIIVNEVKNSIKYIEADAKVKAVEMEIKNFAKVIKRIKRSRSELEEMLDIKPARIGANEKIAEMLSRKSRLESRRDSLFYANPKYRELKKKSIELKKQYKKMRSSMLREQMQIAEKELEDHKKKILESEKFEEYAKKIKIFDEKIKDA